ncbi:hypothetical protein PGT21_027254 [Puccinia graminis f. sp. tritici]|uniref:Uncharacterized protein n=1 Tax=Puccinia graminis f. sp. tritici TaxID=56615 RepID=A0A5B0QYB4_PUCGR|nr:hypothetical protein PGTUg99_014502 [Puccinia graminis f. sp. tritici]KAA1117913.1 hypothetical protein PGT21_027254 [Puccinia graminis f. sp. tritici]
MSAQNPAAAEPPTSRARQFKATKGHKMLSAGFRRLRTISGVYQGRASSEITDEQRPPVPALDRSSSDQNQEPQPSSSPAVPDCLPQSESGKDSATALPALSQLRGIFFVPDANQDPDLDLDSSTGKSRPQSTESRTSSRSPALEDITNSNASIAVSWSEPRDEDSLSSPTSLSTFADSSTGTNDAPSVIGGIMQLICPGNKMLQLSPRACQAAYPPIDLESPYAPYAPTSPLSTTSVRDSNSSTHTQSAHISTFNIRMGLRHLPSIVPKPASKHQAQSREITQQQAISLVTSTPDVQHEQSASSPKKISPNSSNEKTAPALTCPIYVSDSDQCGTPKAEPSSNSAQPTTPKTAGFKEKLGWTGKPKHQHSRSASIARPGSNIPFPCSTHDDSEMAPKQRHERNYSEGAKSMLRGNFNQILTLPIRRIRTSSSISTIFRGIRPGKSAPRRTPSDASFEARPFSMRTESFYEILDPSAIPPFDSAVIPQ